MLAASLVACSNVRRTEVPASEKYTDIKSAVKNIKPLSNIEYGKFIRLNINDLSPSVYLDDAAGRFEVVGIQGSKNQSFQIVLQSICDCTQFRNVTTSPLVYLLDSMGEVIAKEEIVDYRTRVLKGAFPSDGDYRVLVIANNKNEGKAVGEGFVYIGGMRFADPEFIHPTGMIRISWPQSN